MEFHIQFPSNLTRLEIFCNEEWTNISNTRFTNLAATYLKGFTTEMKQKLLSQNTVRDMVALSS